MSLVEDHLHENQLDCGNEDFQRKVYNTRHVDDDRIQRAMENIERELKKAKMQGEEAKKILQECNEISTPPRTERHHQREQQISEGREEEPTYVSSLFRLSPVHGGGNFAASDSPNRPETPQVRYSPEAQHSHVSPRESPAAFSPSQLSRVSPREGPTVYRQTSDGKHERYFPIGTKKRELVLPPPPPPPQPIRSWETPSPTSAGQRTPPTAVESAKPAPKKVAPLLGKVKHPINSTYQNVEPRYLLPSMSKPKAVGTGTPLPQRHADFLSLHSRLNQVNGYDRAQPRYQEPKVVTPPTEELEIPKKRKDKFLKEHKVLKSKLGYDKIQSRLLDGVYGITRSSSCPRSRSVRSSRSNTPVSQQLSRSGSYKKRSSSVVQSPLTARPNTSLVSLDEVVSFTNASETSFRGGGGSLVEDLLRQASKKERLGRFSDAEKLHFTVLRTRQEKFGESTESLIWSFMGLGMLSSAARNWVGAKIHYKEVVHSGLRLGISGEVLQDAKQGLGIALFKSESYHESVVIFENLLSEMSEQFTPSSLSVCKVRSLLSEALFKGGRESEAAELIKLNDAMGYSGSPKPPRRKSISF